jgi:hypothetical protein
MYLDAPVAGITGAPAGAPAGRGGIGSPNRGAFALVVDAPHPVCVLDFPLPGCFTLNFNSQNLYLLAEPN